VYLAALSGALVPLAFAAALAQSTRPVSAVLTLGDSAGSLGRVSFRHRDHARMAETADGCAGCHHAGGVQPPQRCVACHAANRMRANLDVPDLRGAMHRQCLDCHHTWRAAASACGSCHDGARRAARAGATATLAAATPVPARPTTVQYETTADVGAFVTFSHRQHITTFGLRCAACHVQQTCATCHAADTARAAADRSPSATRGPGGGAGGLTVAQARPAPATARTAAAASSSSAAAAATAAATAASHARCASCHVGDSCATCHAGRPVQDPRFDHYARTGWALNQFHEPLDCRACHTRPGAFTKVSSDCQACHRDWEKKFDHRKAGIALDDLHIGVACGDCHTEITYTASPVCGACHTDKTWPADKPGTVVPRPKRP
jgi:hypothetical protein